MSIRPSLQRLASSPSRTMATATAPRDSQTFTLPDGRLLGFAEYGSPNGKPILYFHGYPSCRLEGALTEGMANKLGLRFIGLDRPGFGLSTPQPGRRILDWAADVDAFAKGMEIDRFSVLGLSGGGPYALACARALPRSRVAAVGVFAGAPHWAAGPHHMAPWRQRFCWLVTNYPKITTVVCDAIMSLAKWLASTRFFTSRLDRFLEEGDKKGREKAEAEGKPPVEWAKTKSIPEKREELLRMVIREPFVQGFAASVQEGVLLTEQDWGFRPEDIDYDPIQIWHGSEDANAPAVMIRWMAERIPHSKYTELQNETHYTLVHSLETAICELMDAADKEEKK